MLTGKRFELEEGGLGFDSIDGNWKPMLVPARATVKIISDPTDGHGMVNVLWEGKELAMFLFDIDLTGKEIEEQSPPLETFHW